VGTRGGQRLVLGYSSLPLSIGRGAGMTELHVGGKLGGACANAPRDDGLGNLEHVRAATSIN
jgi:hypothetical protein